MKNLKKIISFVKHQLGAKFFFFLSIALFLVGLFLPEDMLQAVVKNEAVELATSFATLVVAAISGVFVAWGEWKKGLPKRVTAEAVYEGQTLISVRRMPLPEGSDVRAFSQQLLAQAVGARFLKFEPVIESTKVVEEISGAFNTHYRVKFHLLESPAELQGELSDTTVTQRRKENGSLIWEPKE